MLAVPHPSPPQQRPASSISYGCSSPHLLLSQLGIQGVTQRVAQDVECKNDKKDRGARPRRDSGRDLEKLAAVSRHAAELGGWWLRAEAQKGEGGAQQDRLAEL